MLHAIGRKPRKERDLVDSLVECHDRIRMFLALAVAVGERSDIPRLEVSDSCARVGRYFSLALPLHVADEESSLLPRLRERSPSLDAALARMHEQHELHEAMIARLCARASAVRLEPTRMSLRKELAAIARPLHVILVDHLSDEEQIIFPAVRAQIAPAAQEVVRREMEARRDAAAERFG